MTGRARRRSAPWLLAALLAPCAAGAAPPLVDLRVGPAIGELPRFGVNLGARSGWGAEQLMHNVLRNPGLEATLDGALIVVRRIDGDAVLDDTPWTARAAGFWAGARFEVLSGAAAGRVGTVRDSRRCAEGGADRLHLEPMPPGLQRGDVLALQTQADPAPAALWWTQGTVEASAEVRPGSPGQRAVRLRATAAQPAALRHHLDAIGARAGKLLPVQGRWRLSLWVRAVDGPARVRLRFARHGRAAWLDRTIAPSMRWTEVSLPFDATDDGPAQALELSIEVTAGDVLVDDVALGPDAPAAAGGLREPVVQTLRVLRPGYLRDWQGQLADTPANRVAEPFARRPTRYRPGEHERLFAYSLPEFLAVAAEVGARPWVILPATSTPQDARAFGAALREGWLRHRFDEIVVEHGNEHWNAVFRPAGIVRGEALAAVADRCFAALREGAGPQVPLQRVVGTMYVDPAAGVRMAGRLQQAEGIAVAPYFHYRQAADESPAAALERALHEPLDALRATVDGARHAGKAVDVYEVNLHTTGGDATPAQRDAVVTSSGAGVALARRLLGAAALGVRRQTVYALAGYDTYTQTATRDLVQLFGITRDLAGARHWRPTGEALEALNRVTGGSAHRVDCSGTTCNAITALAFDDGRRWAVVSVATTPLRLRWRCPVPVTAQQAWWLADGQSATARAVACVDGAAWLDLPPRALLTVGP